MRKRENVEWNLKHWLKSFLQYLPLEETLNVRNIITSAYQGNLPFCPPYEGDLLYSLIRSNNFKACLETGFLTGSSALYMSAAIADRDGHVTSVCLDNDQSIDQGLSLLRNAGHIGQHRLIRSNSNRAIPDLFLSGERFDLIFMDGWKTFDHLAFEMYFFNQLLRRGGIIACDDSYMPSVRKAIRLLKRYYAFEEIDYQQHNQPFKLRIFQILTRRSIFRNLRAFRKREETQDQPAFRDWNFHRKL